MDTVVRRLWGPHTVVTAQGCDGHWGPRNGLSWTAIGDRGARPCANCRAAHARGAVRSGLRQEIGICKIGILVTVSHAELSSAN